jgi:flagellin
MGFRINTNVQSIAAQRNLTQVRSIQDRALERLSSGNRIVRAGDDAAGLAISEKLKSEIRSTRQAERNAGDGISLIQTAEGGLNEISNIIIRLRELSIQSASDTVGDVERKFSDLEFQNLTKEVDRIASSTRFNGRELLDGQGDSVDIQIGAFNSDNDRLNYEPRNSDGTSTTLGISGLSVTTKDQAQNNLEVLDTALNSINENRAGLGALQNRLGSTINNLQIKVENLSAANSRIRDTDVAIEAAELMRSNILSEASISVLAQANASGSGALKLI